MSNDLEAFLKKNKIKHKNINYFEEAFSHMSYINEMKSNEKQSYERMEFLGDSILSQIVSIYIFEKYPDLDQGKLTLIRSKLVKKDSLSKVGKEISLDKYIRVGKGTREKIITDSVIEDVFESLVAAIYLDTTYEQAYSFVHRVLLSKIKDIEEDVNLKDYKTKLQEYLQNDSEKSISYDVVNKTKNNEKNEIIFQVEVSSNGIVYGSGKGKSKKEAEQNAAKDAYNKIMKG